MQELKKGKLLLIDGEIWRIVGDYTEVSTPIDYELQLVDNPEVWESFRTSTIRNNVENGNWKFVEL